jgi:beta-galactosidase
MEIPGFFLTNFTSVWDNLPLPVNSEIPGTFESYGQDYGLILYTTELKGEKAGKLTVTEIHDYATVFLNGVKIGNLDRSKGINTINIPESTAELPLLEILVEAMGRSDSNDRKGITEKVTLGSEELKDWKIYNLPIDRKFIYGLRSTGKTLNKSGVFFKGNISLIRGSDTYFDVSNFSKGIVWVNGHNIGRFWNVGPQKKLFCPGSFLKQGLNEILILDMNETQPKLIISTTNGD